MVSAPRELPADIKPELTDAIRSMAIEVAELVGVRGVQRIDFLEDDGQLFVNEINTIPGSLSKHSVDRADAALPLVIRRHGG